MHAAVVTFVGQYLDAVPRAARVVELGSRDINGSVRPLFVGATYTGIDLAPGPGVDVVADGATWGETAAYDVGLCLEVLEHAPDPGAIVANLRRLVRPGGLLLVTCATDPRAPHSGHDGGPLRAGEHYANIPAWALADWLRGCAGVWLEVDGQAGDLRAAAWQPEGSA